MFKKKRHKGLMVVGIVYYVRIHTMNVGKNLSGFDVESFVN